MGKNGNALRAAKLQKTTFTITRGWLEAHDKEVIQNYKKIVYDEAQKWLDSEIEKVQKNIDEEWKQREKDFGGADSSDRFLSTLGYMLSATCTVLVRDFGWTPLPKDKNPDPRMKLVRLCTAIAKEVEMICDDEEIDIRRYCADAYEKYGVKFEWKDVDEDEVKAERGA